AHERHTVQPLCRVRAWHSARPQVGNGNPPAPLGATIDCGLLTTPVDKLRIEIADLFPRPLDEPLSPTTDIVGERRPEALRVVERAKLDDVRDRIELKRRRFTAKACCLEWDRATTREHVEHLRGFVTVGLSDLFSRLDDRGSRSAPCAEAREETVE